MMLINPKYGSFTSHLASQCVTRVSRYMTTTGVPMTAHSSVAVPDEDSATSESAMARPPSCGTMRRNVSRCFMISNTSAVWMVGAWMT